MKTITFIMHSDEDSTVAASDSEYVVSNAEELTVEDVCMHFSRFLVTLGYAHYDIVALREGEVAVSLYENDEGR